MLPNGTYASSNAFFAEYAAADLYILQIPSRLQAVVFECINPDTNRPPNLKQLEAKLSPFLTRQKLVDGIMSRLVNYSGDLEDLVARRTTDLLIERKKVDEVLGEMIPSYVQ